MIVKKDSLTITENHITPTIRHDRQTEKRLLTSPGL